ncbi:MAG: site-specific integrase [Deltaproteobacteria bacterium]|nr:site-specific integrase [Deltaproteobacteria bacterium]
MRPDGASRSLPVPPTASRLAPLPTGPRFANQGRSPSAAAGPDSTTGSGVDADALVDADPDGPSFGSVAAAWLQEHEDDFAAGELALNSIRLYRRLINKRLIPALGDMPIAEIALPDLRRFHRSLADRPAEANHSVRVARRVLQAAEEQGLRPANSNYARRIRLHAERASANPASRVDTMRLFEICAEIRAGRLGLCHPTMAALFQVVQTTGARPSEIRTCKWSDVKWRTEFALLRLDHRKTARDAGSKTIVLDPIARGVFLSLEPDDPEDPTWVFPSHCNPGAPYRDVTRAWRRVVDYASTSLGVCLRDFRSGMATNAYDQGVPLEVIQEMMGHRSIATTRHYTRISRDRVAVAYQRTNGSVFSGKGKGGRRG